MRQAKPFWNNPSGMHPRSAFRLRKRDGMKPKRKSNTGTAPESSQRLLPPWSALPCRRKFTAIRSTAFLRSPCRKTLLSTPDAAGTGTSGTSISTSAEPTAKSPGTCRTGNARNTRNGRGRKSPITMSSAATFRTGSPIRKNAVSNALPPTGRAFTMS